MAAMTSGRNWYLIIGGILLIVFGFVCFFYPGLTLVSIAFMAGVGFAFAGIMNIVSYAQYRGLPGVTGWMIAYGILDLLVAAMFLIHPLATSSVIPWLIGAFVLAFGIAELVQCVSLKRQGFAGWGYVLVSGIVNVILGVLFFAWPPLLAVYIAVYCVFAGATLIGLGATKVA